MPYPPFADIETNYTAFQQGQGDNSFPGQQVDTDLANLVEAVDTLNEFVRGFSRSDGEIGNQTIGHDQLKPELSIGLEPPTAWAAETDYLLGNTVFFELAYYRATADHTSSVSFAADLAAELWEELIDFEAGLTESLEEIVEPIVEGLVPEITEDVLAQVPALVDPMIESAVDDLREELVVTGTDLTVNIPSDYATLQLAVDALSTRSVEQGHRIVLNIETGHEPTHGIAFVDGDFSHFWITSTDAEVTLPSGFIGADTFDGPDINTANCFISCTNARGPVLDTVIDADGNADSGYSLFAKSTGWVNRHPNENELTDPPPLPRKCGIKNCAKYNFRARDGSVLYAEAVIASGSARSGFYANRCSTIHCVQSDVTDCVDFGMVADRGSTIVADMSDATGCAVGFFAIYGSLISASDAVADDCGIGFFASMVSSIVAQGATADDAVEVGTSTDYYGRGFVAIRGSRINAYSSSAEGAVNDGYFADEGGHIIAVSASADGAGENGFSARGAASAVEAPSSSAVGVGMNAFQASNGATVNARSATGTGAAVNGAFATAGSQINAELAVLTGATASAVYATKGSRINAYGATLHTAGGSEVRVDHGSFITVSTATTRTGSVGVPNVADTNVVAFNTLYGAGVVFNN